MIVVLVGDQDGVERGDVFADGCQTFGDFAAAETGIDQDTGAVRGEEGGITGTAAGENANFDDASSPYRSLSVRYSRSGTKNQKMF
jgi:hypothetical protein